MPSACATPRASAIACGPQHLSSALEIQSCGQTFIVTPTTSQPCSRSKYPATLESTPPLIPSKTRRLVLFIETKNFDECQIESMNPVAASLYEAVDVAPRATATVLPLGSRTDSRAT